MASLQEPVIPVTMLVPVPGAASPVQQLQDTLEYATSPKSYLVRRLGGDVFKQRSELFSITEELIDRDMYGTGVHKQHFEQHIATVLGKKHGLFFITGIQAQQSAIKIHCDRAGNDRVAWHFRSHLEIAEEHAFAEVFHLKRAFVGKSHREVPTVADVKAVTSLPKEKRPAVLLLELPNRELGCKTYPFDDLVQISKLCRDANVKLHMDGARLWEIEPFYQGKTLADIAALFDSVYVSFYKGLAGTVGAMLTSSDEEFMEKAKTWQKRLGGCMVTSYPAVIDCERGYNLNIGTFHLKWKKMCSVASAIIEATKEYSQDGKPIVYFDPEVPTCCQIYTHVQGATAEKITAARDKVEKEYRIGIFRAVGPWETLDEIDTEQKPVNAVDDAVGYVLATQKEKSEEKSEKNHYFFEWMIRSENLNIGDDVFAKGWKAFCQIIASGQ